MSIYLNQNAVYSLCRNLGFTPKQARIGSAIALCESPVYGASTPMSDFSAIGDQDLADNVWGYSYGGFQIRSLRDQTGTGGLRDADRLLTPRFNCRSAKAIRLESGWTAWSTYSSGKYKAYLQEPWFDLDGKYYDALFPPEPGTYVVVSGDTLSKIASRYSVSTEELALLNDIAGPKYLITIGQVLSLPDL